MHDVSERWESDVWSITCKNKQSAGPESFSNRSFRFGKKNILLRALCALAVQQGDTLEEVWALKDICLEIRRGEAGGRFHATMKQRPLLYIKRKFRTPKKAHVKSLQEFDFDLSLSSGKR